MEVVEDARTHGLLSDKNTAEEQRKRSHEQNRVGMRVSPSLEGKRTETRMSVSVKRRWDGPEGSPQGPPPGAGVISKSQSKCPQEADIPEQGGRDTQPQGNSGAQAGWSDRGESCSAQATNALQGSDLLKLEAGSLVKTRGRALRAKEQQKPSP